MKKLELVFIGSGGTGTYVLKEFSRYISHSKAAELIGGMTIVDGDIIEEKNLNRQAFTQEDIGYNKATVMATVLNEAFGLQYKAYAKYILSSADIRGIVDDGSIPVIIGCVDNHGCRLDCEEFFQNSDTCIYIDAANEFHEGECVVALRMKGETLAPCRSHYFPEIKTRGKRITEISCEELNNSAPQHILANMQSGLVVLSHLVSFLETGKLNGGVTSYNVFTRHMKEHQM